MVDRMEFLVVRGSPLILQCPGPPPFSSSIVGKMTCPLFFLKARGNLPQEKGQEGRGLPEIRPEGEKRVKQSSGSSNAQFF